MELRTTFCSGFGRPEFLIRCDESIPIADVDWLVGVFEQSVRQGTEYRNGELVQIGWMFDRLREVDDKTLLVTEPNMRSMPIDWVDGVTETLRHLRLQKDVADSIGAMHSMEFPAIEESALIGADVSVTTKSFVLDRASISAPDSGWFLGCLDSELNYNDPRNLRRISLYEAALICPKIIMFLSLPAGTRVECRPGGISIFQDGRESIPSEGSFLAEYATRIRRMK